MTWRQTIATRVTLRRGRRALQLAALCAVLACGARSGLQIPIVDGEAAEGGETAGDDGAGGLGGGGGQERGGTGASSGAPGGVSRGASGDTSSNGSGATVGGASTGCGEDAPLPPSCAPGGPGLTNCGTCNESCCRSVEVAGGTFDRTYTNQGAGPDGGADPASVSGLRVDKYLVTVGRFRQFVGAWRGGYTPPAGSGKHTHLNGGQGLASAGAPGMFEPGWVASDDGWLDPTDPNLTGCPDTTWTAAPGDQENLPINCVDWWEAYAFCIWDGAFLPSEAEWEYVAAGGAEEREYPWGSTPPGTRSQYAILGYGEGLGCYYPSAGRCTGVANIADVGKASEGAGRWSHLDLAGNVGEWGLDWFAPSYVDPCTDCAEVSSAMLRVIRGGAYDLDATDIVPTFREGRYPPGRNGDVGFRCARAP